jgi:cell division protein FtsQ
MDRSPPRGASRPGTDDARVPRVSRLTIRPARKANRRAPSPLVARLPRPRQIADACGRALRRGGPVLAALAVVAVLGGAGLFGYRWLTTSPRFAVARVEVRGGAVLDADAVRARLPFAVGDNIFGLDTGAAEQALLAEPWIARASIRRRLPRTVVVEIVERTPAALVSSEGLYLADADGRPFKRADLARGEGAGLPVISGIARDTFTTAPALATARVRDGLAVFAAWSGADRPRAGEIAVEPGGTTVYTYDAAIAVRVGATDPDRLAAHLARFDAVWAALSPDERRTLRAMRVDNDTRTDLVTVSFH